MFISQITAFVFVTQALGLFVRRLFIGGWEPLANLLCLGFLAHRCEQVVTPPFPLGELNLHLLTCTEVLSHLAERGTRNLRVPRLLADGIAGLGHSVLVTVVPDLVEVAVDGVSS